MSPDTRRRRIERVVGTTHDGIDLFESQGYRLRFFPCCFQRHCGGLIGCSIEWNRDAFGRKRPYYVLSIFGFGFTGGWLFDVVAEGGAR